MRTTSPGRFTVFLIDDDQGRRDTLNSLLRAVGYETRAYTAPQRFIDEHDPAVHGCTLLDLSMAGLNTLDVQQELVRRGIDRPVIVLTGSELGPCKGGSFQGRCDRFFGQTRQRIRIVERNPNRGEARQREIAHLRRCQASRHPYTARTTGFSSGRSRRVEQEHRRRAGS